LVLGIPKMVRGLSDEKTVQRMYAVLWYRFANRVSRQVSQKRAKGSETWQLCL